MKREQIACIAHEVNRAYCASLGDDSQPAWEEAPEWQQESILAGVDMHLANPEATPETSHASWLEQKIADGWQYGEEKDLEAKLHPCCVPYEELPPEQKAKDFLFRGVVHALKDIPDADEAVEAALIEVAATAGANQVTGLPPAAIPAGTEPVKYIGRRPEWHDRLYNTGLYFTTGQTRAVPFEVARKFLRHADLFERGTLEQAPPALAPAAGNDLQDDTQRLMEKARLEQEQRTSKQQEIQAVYDEIDRMGKEGVIDFANQRYQQKLKKADRLADLQSQAKALVDQFGVV